MGLRHPHERRSAAGKKGKKDSMHKKPKPEAPPPPSPVQETGTPNGGKVGQRYYCYLFHAESNMDTGRDDLAYLPACAKDLAGRRYENFGEACMGVCRKFLGVRRVERIDLRWWCNTFRLDVVITLTGEPPATIGWLEPSDEYHTRHADGTETRFVPHPHTAPPQPLDPSLLEATRPVPGETPAPPAPKPITPPVQRQGGKTGGVRVVRGVEISPSPKNPELVRVFGHPLMAVVRWCGAGGWPATRVFRLIVNLGLGEDVEVETVEKHMERGRKGNKGPPLGKSHARKLEAAAI